MKPLSLGKAVGFYLEKRRQLGFALKADGQMLRQLARYAAGRRHRGPLTTRLALAWAQSPAGASRLWWALRLDTVRRFAVFWSAFDPRTQVPPAGVLGPAYRRRAVHLYTPQEIAQLMQAAGQLGGLDGLTFRALLGLLACTGLRIGEALRLETRDIDWTAGSLTIRHSKFGRSRCVPLHPSSLSALKRYHRKQRPHRSPASPDNFFLWRKQGRAIAYKKAAATFRTLCDQLGWTQEPVPRLHDLRHTFAVGCLMDWHRGKDEPAAKVLALATYLGHGSLKDTYWYLSAVPELFALVHARRPQPGGPHA